MERLLDAYKRILQEVDAQSFNLNEDKYSGVFLPVLYPLKNTGIHRQKSCWLDVKPLAGIR